VHAGVDRDDDVRARPSRLQDPARARLRARGSLQPAAARLV